MLYPTLNRALFVLLTIGFVLFTPSVTQAAVQLATDLDVAGRGRSPLRYSSFASGLSNDSTEVVGSWVTTQTATSEQDWLVPDGTERSDSSGTDAAPQEVNAVAVPEPATWMLLVAGVGLVAWTARQRLRAASLVGNH